MGTLLNILTLIGTSISVLLLIRFYPIIKQIVYSNDLLLLKLKTIMANIKDLQAQVAQLQSDLDTEQAQIAAAIDALNQSIADLQQLIVDGGTAEERQALSDALTAISDDLKNTIPDESTTTSTTESTTETTTEAPVEPEPEV